MFDPIDAKRYNMYELTRQLDITKSRVFMGQNSAFLGSLMCSMPMIWTNQVKTAATNGEYIWWSPDDFLTICQMSRDSTILHELWHKARLHSIRCGERDGLIWNYACDIRINNDLRKIGFTFPDLTVWEDMAYDGWVEEDIYDDLIKNGHMPGNTDIGFGSGGDMFTNLNQSKEMPPPDPAKLIADVVQAVQEAERMGESGSWMEGIKTNLQQFLKPVVVWDKLLWRWLTEKLHSRRTWRKPNRRHQRIYLPSSYIDRGKLEHLVFFFDVSGSVSDTDAIRIGSEIKYVKEKFKPKKLSVVQFDDHITHEQTFTDKEGFHEINIVGRGGTDLNPVRQWMIDHKPTAAVVFSDLICQPMRALEPEDMIPIIWIAVGNKHATVPHGEMIYIKG